MMPMNGSHQGAAPQRDFLLLTPAAEDRGSERHARISTPWWP